MSTFFRLRHGEAAKRLGVSIPTLRRWEVEKRLVPERTRAGHRRYDAVLLDELVNRKRLQPGDKTTIAYARVSSTDQKTDLDRQKQVLELFCAGRGWTYELISDPGSGMNYRKKGLTELLEKLLTGKVERLVLTHKDRLLRFGAELIFSICEMMNVEVVIINRGAETSFEEDLAKDVLEIITVFSARLYGARSRKNQKLITAMRKAVRDSEE